MQSRYYYNICMYVNIMEKFGWDTLLYHKIRLQNKVAQYE